MVVVKEFFLSWRRGMVKSMSRFCCFDCAGIGFGGDGSGTDDDDDDGGGGSDDRCTGGLSLSFFCDILTIDFYFFMQINLHLYV